MKATLQRLYLDDRTIGVFNIGDFECFTLELPDKNNQVNISCIPEGTYICKKIVSQSLGDCYDVLCVEGRTFIRIHTGNHLHQIQGCILVGEFLQGKDIHNSRRALNALFNQADKFELTIF